VQPRDLKGRGAYRRPIATIPITAVRVPSAETGKQSASLIRAQLERGADARSIERKAKLMERASCAPLPARRGRNPGSNQGSNQGR
jgi:hypothetical protein